MALPMASLPLLTEYKLKSSSIILFPIIRSIALKTASTGPLPQAASVIVLSFSSTVTVAVAVDTPLVATDIFFIDINHGDIEERKKIAMEKLYKIISLGNKIINEFYINIISAENNDIKNAGHVVYHSNIISIIQIISINCAEFNIL